MNYKVEKVNIPPGRYTPASRMRGSDWGMGIYQVGHSIHSDTEKYREGYERIFGEKKEEKR